MLQISVEKQKYKKMTVSSEIVSLKTSDNIILDGIIIRPTNNNPADRTKPIFVMVHGLTMNFYNPLFISIAQSMSEHGFASLLLNNRGHDLFSTRHDFQQKMGAIWETIEECTQDIEVAIRFVKCLDFNSVILLGHSLGGLKAIYYQAMNQNEFVKSIVLCSPTRSMKAIYKFRLGDRFSGIVTQAEENMRNEHPNRLISLYPIWPYILSSKTIVNFMAEKSAANIYNYIGQIKCSVLTILDDSEKNYEFKNEATLSKRCDMIRINGADHFYNGFYVELVNAILNWLKIAIE